MECSSENESECSSKCSSECSSECDIYDILEREISPKEKLFGTLNNLNMLIETSAMKSLMKDDVEIKEYNRNYNYYYKDEYSQKYDSEEMLQVNYQNKLQQLNRMIKNIIKITKTSSDTVIVIAVELMNYMLEVFIIDIMENIQYYSITGKKNCLHDTSKVACKILLSLSDKQKISTIQDTCKAKNTDNLKLLMNTFLQ
jgi:hypothetical protein